MAGVGLRFGPILIGVLLNCILYGAMVVQTLVYFQSYKGQVDPRWFKIFVFYLLVCETLNTICDIGLVYEPLIVRYGTERAITVAPIMLLTDPILTVMVSTPVQFFIAWRVNIMSKSIIVPAIIVFLAVCSFIGGIATAVSVAILDHYSQFHQFFGAPLTWLAAATAADLLITASLVYNLSRQRTGFAATDDLINKIIRLTVQTGMVTSMFALLDIAFFLALSMTELNFIFDLALSKLYSNSLLSTLNARGGWRATSTVRDNVLFGDVLTNGEGVVSSRTQIELVAVNPRTGRTSSITRMKDFDAEAGYREESASNDSSKYIHRV